MLFPSDYTEGQESAHSEGTLTRANLCTSLAIDKGSRILDGFQKSAELPGFIAKKN